MKVVAKTSTLPFLIVGEKMQQELEYLFAPPQMRYKQQFIDWQWKTITT